jgi:hypothetical protein
VIDDRSSLQESHRGTVRSVSELRARSGPIPLDRMGPVRTEYDLFPMSQMTRSGSCISTDPQGRYEVHEVSLNVDVESSPEEE